jgi:hypothetical protein
MKTCVILQPSEKLRSGFLKKQENKKGDEMKIKTNELTGAALDWAVAKCEGHNVFIKHAPVQVMYTPERKRSWYIYTPSTNWAQGGPIIEREKITVRFWEGEDYVHAYKWNHEGWLEGPTPLTAAMRCYVASKLGDDIDLPKELT